MVISVNENPDYRDANSKMYDGIVKAKQLLAEAEAKKNKKLIAQAEKNIEKLFEEFFLKNQALAIGLARPFVASSADHADDYINAARLGMWEAVRKWDPSKGGTFGTFSRPFIKGQLVRAVRANEYNHISQTDFNKRRLVLETQLKLSEELGRTPTIDEIAAKSEVHSRIVKRTLVTRPISMDAPIGTEDSTMKDLIADSHTYDELNEETPLFNSMLEDLNDLELWLTLNRSGVLGTFKQSIVEISDEIGIGREILRRSEVRSKSRMMYTKLALETNRLPSVEEVSSNLDQLVDTVALHLKPSWPELRARWTLVDSGVNSERLKLLFLEVLNASAKLVVDFNTNYRTRHHGYADPNQAVLVIFKTFIAWNPDSDTKFTQVLRKECSKIWKRTTNSNQDPITESEIVEASELFWHSLLKNNIVENKKQYI